MRIAVAGFQHETNTFAPFGATYADFERADGWPALTLGNDILDLFPSLNIATGGFLAAMLPRHEIVPLAWCSAEPCAEVEDAAFDRVAGLVLDGLAAAGRLDGLYLDLHGAMVTQSHQDGEGELLRRIRARVGPELPIVVSLDLHANLTAAMVERADALAIYRTYPHIDMAETGAEAARLMEMLLGGTRLVRDLRPLPYLVPLNAQCTDAEPCRALYGLVAQSQRGAIARTDFAAGFPAADIHDAGPAILVQGTDAAQVARTADALLAAGLAAEDRFDGRMVPPGEAVRLARGAARPGRPAVLAEVQDNPGGGGSSDGTGLLRALVSEGAGRAALALFWDPAAAERAHQAGIGAELELALGGRFTPGDRPFAGRFRVEALSSGSFLYGGVMLRGVTASLGPMAVLRVLGAPGDVRVVVNSVRFQCLDLEIFRHIGIEPTELDILGVKSTVHFRADFAPIAAAIIPVDAPGLLPCRLEHLDYRRLRGGVRLGPGGPLRG
jgi:microcystin degradation protein MlrC